jgi:peptide/nickel transport system permease protein
MTAQTVVQRGEVVDHEVAALQTSSRVWWALRRDPSFWMGVIGIGVIAAAAIAAPLLSPHDPVHGFRKAVDGIDGLSARGDPLGPSALFPLGTDRLGRDYFSRLLYGARTSLTVGLVANLLATLIGVSVGSIAAFVGSRSIHIRLGALKVRIPVPIEAFLMRITDAVLSFPALLLAIALVAVIGASLALVIFVIAAVLWTGIARIVYSRVLVVREAEFVVAARAAGIGERRILVRHVMPHLVSLIVVYATLGIASTVLFEATLSFLGVGVPPPGASWGGEISDGLGYYLTDPRLVVLPGLAIMATILAFNLLGDALADAFDPHQWR